MMRMLIWRVALCYRWMYICIWCSYESIDNRHVRNCERRDGAWIFLVLSIDGLKKVEIEIKRNIRGIETYSYAEYLNAQINIQNWVFNSYMPHKINASTGKRKMQIGAGIVELGDCTQNISSMMPHCLSFVFELVWCSTDGKAMSKLHTRLPTMRICAVYLWESTVWNAKWKRSVYAKYRCRIF